jgi:hypothetical protein
MDLMFYLKERLQCKHKGVLAVAKKTESDY